LASTRRPPFIFRLTTLALPRDLCSMAMAYAGLVTHLGRGVKV
jgi:hypothetical protein